MCCKCFENIGKIEYLNSLVALIYREALIVLTTPIVRRMIWKRLSVNTLSLSARACVG